MLERARNGFDGEAEIVGDILTRHRQLDRPAGGRAVRHFQEEPRDPLFRALDQHQRHDDAPQRAILKFEPVSEKISCRRRLLNTKGKHQSILSMPPVTTRRLPNTTRPDITKRRHTTLTLRGAT